MIFLAIFAQIQKRLNIILINILSFTKIVPKIIWYNVNKSVRCKNWNKVILAGMMGLIVCLRFCHSEFADIKISCCKCLREQILFETSSSCQYKVDRFESLQIFYVNIIRRSCDSQMFFKLDALKNFAIITGK